VIEIRRFKIVGEKEIEKADSISKLSFDEFCKETAQRLNKNLFVTYLVHYKPDESRSSDGVVTKLEKVNPYFELGSGGSASLFTWDSDGAESENKLVADLCEFPAGHDNKRVYFSFKEKLPKWVTESLLQGRLFIGFC